MNTVIRALPKPLLYLGKIDKVALAIAAILAVVAVVDPPQLSRSVTFIGGSVRNTFPYLIISVLLAGYAKASGAENLIARAFSGSAKSAIIVAALMGAISPFCSCGVIPVIAALLSIGVPLGPVMAFWLSSPLMDPSMFIMTTATLGLQFAVAKTIAAVLIGISSGFVAAAFVQGGIIQNVLQDQVGNGGCAGSKIRNPKAVVWRMWREPERRNAFLTSAKTNGLFLGKWLVFAFVLESLMVAWMPTSIAGATAFKGGFLPILVGTLVGIPSYLNGYAALPLVHGLIEQGLSPGAAMAFLIAGGVTSIPAAIAVWVVATKRVFALYLALGTISSLLVGLAYAQWVGA